VFYFFFVVMYQLRYGKLIEDLNFFHNVFKTLGLISIAF